MLSLVLCIVLSVFPKADSTEGSSLVDESSQTDMSDRSIIVICVVAIVVFVAFLLFLCLLCSCNHCCCRGKSNKGADDLGQPLSFDFNGTIQPEVDKSIQIIEEPRSCHDVLCLLIFFLFCIAILVFFIIGFTEGNPRDAIDPINSLFGCRFFIILLLYFIFYSADISAVVIQRVLI